MRLCLIMLMLQTALFNSNNVFAQQSQSKTITGIVTDSEGFPLIGVAVLAKGTTNGTVTKLDGDYAIEAPAGAETLQFSYIGYQTQEVTIGTQSIINVTLTEEAVGLNEVVITALGISREKE
ncbi:carboxypeptidase-like regulatory domain-containing protein, partial [uncultured Cyclobacterium sp.]|uniref:carboxypeptidase-like regulatory domain-containing protein n=1 Tax=uncultured Cyclobacterium sp. TaxID=453820 RepID=UPI0030EC24E7